MTREELLDTVPVHWHNGRPFFIRLEEIPEPWRGQFREALIGSAVPVLPGEGELAHAYDWHEWVAGQWYGRGPSGLSSATVKQILMQRHPWQWSRCRGLDVPPEWMPVLVELSDAVADRVTEDLARESFSWRDIKEKRGGLSIDYSGPDIDDLVDAAIDQVDTLNLER